MVAVATRAGKLPLSRLAVAAGVHPKTVRHWANQGVRGVRLQLHRVGSRYFGTLEDLTAFQRAVDTKGNGPAE